MIIRNRSWHPSSRLLVYLNSTLQCPNVRNMFELFYSPFCVEHVRQRSSSCIGGCIWLSRRPQVEMRIQRVPG